MKRKVFALFMATITVLSFAACSGGNASAPAEEPDSDVSQEAETAEAPESNADKETVSWTLGSTATEDDPSIVVWQSIADELSTQTDGRFTLNLYTSSAIGNETEMIEMVRTNTLTMMATNLTTPQTFIEDFSVFGLPYLFHSAEDLLNYTSSEGNRCAELFQRLEDEYNLRVLDVEINGTRCLTTKGIKQITTPDDLKGIKIRSMDAQSSQDTITALGGTPIPISFSELYMALQTGVVNGQDNPISVTYTNKLYEVADYIYRTDHSYNTCMWLINPDAYDSLDAEDRELFDSLVEKYIQDEYPTLISDYIETAETDIEASGCKIIDVTDFDIEAFYKNAAVVVDENYLVNETFAPYIEEIRETYHYE